MSYFLSYCFNVIHKPKTTEFGGDRGKVRKTYHCDCEPQPWGIIIMLKDLMKLKHLSGAGENYIYVELLCHYKSVPF